MSIKVGTYTNEICEEMLNDGVYSEFNEQQFLEEYVKRHAEKYNGEEFVPYYGGAW